MSIQRTIGGNRVGSGAKMTVDLKSYERSTHDLGYIWRSTMASGTLVPFMSEVGLPGDTFDINLDADIKTHPTIGPLFGSYKVQLDVFMAPIRLYQGQLHNNRLGIGMDMAKVKLPQIRIEAGNPNFALKDIDNSQINPSSILSYLNIRGLGVNTNEAPDPNTVIRDFNAVPYIAYWDIYKNYYANKQEEIGAVIHTDLTQEDTVSSANYYDSEIDDEVAINEGIDTTFINASWNIDYSSQLNFFSTGPILDANNIILNYVIDDIQYSEKLSDLEYWIFEWNAGASRLTGVYTNNITKNVIITGYTFNNNVPIQGEPRVVTFPLTNIDDMRYDIQSDISTTPFMIDKTTYAPYGYVLQKNGQLYTKLSSQEGLAIKTYQSDLFNNWMSTEWIQGPNGINDITAIDTTSGSFTIDTFQLSKKVYDMLNRIAISGGTYDDWLDTVYTHDRVTRIETPMYMGGLSKELVFQEVYSTTNTETADGTQPLGTLAGKGGLANKHKGGKVTVKVDEPCYIIGIVSLTPRIDYSQGNKWDTNLKTMDDFHKPALDEIGYQNLITDQMAWFDTKSNGVNDEIFSSAGQQPAWLNYMTNVNQVRGNFAIQDNEMFMTLNRRYEKDEIVGIKDLTTYIDPVKFNFIFAETALDAQNFWTQIACDITARRKMSAKIMPNL